MHDDKIVDNVDSKITGRVQTQTMATRCLLAIEREQKKLGGGRAMAKNQSVQTPVSMDKWKKM
jgi:hypothetical protein